MRYAILGLLVVAGCSSVGLNGQLVRIEPGPAFGREVRSIASLTATCGAMESMNYEGPSGSECSPAMIARVDDATLGFLHAARVRTVRTQSLNAATFDKLKAQRSELRDANTEDDLGSRVLFRSASPVLQTQILEELNVDGVLRTRLLVGASVGMSQRRRIVALITLFDREGTLVWASRCEREVSLTVAAGEVTFGFSAGDLIETTMCALEEAASL